MTLFQLIMFGAAAYFAWQVYKFVQNLQDGKPNLPSDNGERPVPTASTVKTRDTQPASDTSSALAPGVPELLAKADAAYERGDLTDTRFYLERAEKQDPDNPEILNKLAFVLHRQGEDDEALHYYERSLRIAPDDDLTHNAIAEVLRSLGRLDEAQEHYKAAVDIDDTYEETYYNYGTLLRDKGDHAGAKLMFQKALELKPDYTEAKAALEQLDAKERA